MSSQENNDWQEIDGIQFKVEYLSPRGQKNQPIPIY
jgi:hypothetical protein